MPHFFCLKIRRTTLQIGVAKSMLFNLYAHTLAVIRLHLSKKNNPLLNYTSRAKPPNANPLSANKYSVQNHPVQKHGRHEITWIPWKLFQNTESLKATDYYRVWKTHVALKFSDYIPSCLYQNHIFSTDLKNKSFTIKYNENWYLYIVICFSFIPVNYSDNLFGSYFIPSVTCNSCQIPNDTG